MQLLCLPEVDSSSLKYTLMNIKVSLYKYHANPILQPQGNGWESSSVFNPAAWADDNTVYLLYRAEGPSESTRKGIVSTIGLATSNDGIKFNRYHEPVLEPVGLHDGAGVEDPRVVKINNIFYMTYSAFDGDVSRLAITESHNLIDWDRHRLMLQDSQWNGYSRGKSWRKKGWSKSGAILSKPVLDHYWMYFGDTHIWAARSRDLENWTVVGKPILSPRDGFFDSHLVEPGPPPIITPYGIWLGYNAAENIDEEPHYSFGHALMSLTDPTRVIWRSPTPIMTPTTKQEKEGQISNVVFCEGLVDFKNKRFLYYGMADKHVGVAIMQGPTKLDGSIPLRYMNGA